MAERSGQIVSVTPAIAASAKDMNSYSTQVIGTTVYLLSEKSRVVGAYSVDPAYGITIASSIAEARSWYESDK